MNGDPGSGALVAGDVVGESGGPDVVVLDSGSGNVRSAVRALQRAGARVELTASAARAQECDGLVVPGQGAFSAVMAGLMSVGAPKAIERRLAGGRPVLGICVGLQVMFDGSTEPYSGGVATGLAQWPGTARRLPAAVVPHMGWSTVTAPAESVLFEGVADERFYFVHSYGVQRWELDSQDGQVARFRRPAVTWAEHGAPFVAAVEDGPLAATQFHPEKSGDAGARLLRNWVASLPR